LVAGLVAIVFSSTANAEDNLLLNPGFEDNPPTQNGDNLGHSIAPWVMTSGTPNIVHVDGPGGQNYAAPAPQSDASESLPGTWCNYLDFAGRAYTFQSFVPRCSGEVRFGGYFSTRSNSLSWGSITLRRVGESAPNGTNVAQHVIELPVEGSSRDDPWTRYEFTAQVTAGTQYLFMVGMYDDMNFDEAFVIYQDRCLSEQVDAADVAAGLNEQDEPPQNPILDFGEIETAEGVALFGDLPQIYQGSATVPATCCPALDEITLLGMLRPNQTGGLADPYAIGFAIDQAWAHRWQAYLEYLNALDPQITGITMQITLESAGTGSTPVPGGSEVGHMFLVWTPGAAGPVTTGSFGTIDTNAWYLFNVDWASMIDYQPGPSSECSIEPVAYRISVRGRGGDNPTVVFHTTDQRDRVRNIERLTQPTNQ